MYEACRDPGFELVQCHFSDSVLAKARCTNKPLPKSIRKRLLLLMGRPARCLCKGVETLGGV